MKRIIAVDPDAVNRYVPEDAREWPEADQPVFLLKALKAREAAKLQDHGVEVGMGTDNTMRVLSGSTIIRALELGLVGWENFKDASGNEVEWRENNGKGRPENLDRIPERIRRELAEVIAEGTFFMEQEEKNSD